jgi:phage FluMu gp28-like protein
MVTIPVSVGELIDKLSILQVKKNKINNEEKLVLVNKEFELLYNLSSVYLDSVDINGLYHQLCSINKKLWDVEDELRILETRKSFNSDFIELARKVYYTNDERFRLKNKINSITSSEIREVKDYKPY